MDNESGANMQSCVITNYCILLPNLVLLKSRRLRLTGTRLHHHIRITQTYLRAHSVLFNGGKVLCNLSKVSLELGSVRNEGNRAGIGITRRSRMNKKSAQN